MVRLGYISVVVTVRRIIVGDDHVVLVGFVVGVGFICVFGVVGAVAVHVILVIGALIV